MRTLAYSLAIVFLPVSAPAADPTRAEVTAALRSAVRFYHGTIADHGGYVWVSSPDGRLREGEGLAGPGTIWVQPPGTPAVGLAYLDVFAATGEPAALRAAEDAASALIKGQLRSGGWHYRIEFDPKKRAEFVYRDGPKGDRPPETPAPGGWDVWKQRRYKGDMTVLDDDTTPAALRFLMRFDQATGFKNEAVRNAIQYALSSVINAQYPIGAWSHTYDRYPARPPAEDHYPVKAASFPDSWSRTWTRDWTGCYMLNDRITTNLIRTLLLAHQIYGEKRFLRSAERGGQFLRLAQLPDPQPAWAQQYNRHMQPVWDRKFEPPAITGLESQDVLLTLLDLYRETGDRDYLKPLPTALTYLKTCVLPDGQLARFYELKTSRPLYFTRDYQLTHDPKDMPTHYAFKVRSRLDAVEAEYRRLLDALPGDLRKEPRPRLSPALAEAVQKVLSAQDATGAWTEPGTVRDGGGKKVTPKGGVVRSQTFIDHVTILCRYLATTK
jgi:hypothetical protein